MSVYNAERFLQRAIESVLGQTLHDFELIVVDDGSTDKSEQVIRGFADPRIRSFSQPNKGVGAGLNRGIEEARSELIARMDADDVSMPDRLRREVQFMETSVDTVLLGSSFIVLDEYGARIDLHPGITEDEDIRRAMYVRNPFPGGGVMMRRGVLRDVGAYDPSLAASVDADLFFRISQRGRLANLPEILYCWRFTTQGITHRRGAQQEAVFERLALELWSRSSPMPLTMGEVRSKARTYRSLGRSVHVSVDTRYIENEFDLGVLMLRRRGSFGKGIRQLASVLAAAPVSLATVLVPRYGRDLASRSRVMRSVITKAKGMTQPRARSGKV